MTPVIFDLDGTLIDSLGGITRAANATLADWGLPPLGPEVTAGFVGRGERVFVERLIGRTALEADMERVLKRFIRHYEVAAQETPLMPGAREAIDRLKAAGRPLGLVTNKPRAPLLPTLEAAGLSADFDVVFAGDDLSRRKPDALPLLTAMERLQATRVVYVGDSDIDAETARAAGQPFALYSKGIRTVRIEDIPADAVFSEFSELDGVIDALTG